MKWTLACRSTKENFSRKGAKKFLLGNAFELDEPAELRDHHSLFTLQTARERGAIALIGLSLHVIPDLAVRTFAVPAKIAVGDRVNREVLKAAQQPVFLGYTDRAAHDFESDKLVVRIQQIRSSVIEVAALFTHRQRQYNRSLLKFVQNTGNSTAGVKIWP